jgi:hypothetical protein
MVAGKEAGPVVRALENSGVLARRQEQVEVAPDAGEARPLENARMVNLPRVYGSERVKLSFAGGRT